MNAGSTSVPSGEPGGIRLALRLVLAAIFACCTKIMGRLDQVKVSASAGRLVEG